MPAHSLGVITERDSGESQLKAADTNPEAKAGKKAVPAGKILLDRRGAPSIGVDIDDQEPQKPMEEEPPADQSAVPAVPATQLPDLEMLKRQVNKMPAKVAPGTGVPATGAPAKPAPTPESSKVAPPP